MADKPTAKPATKLGTVPEYFLELLANPISFHPSIARLCGSVTAGLMLSQAIYWSRTEIVKKRDGWFYKSIKEWTEETCLSRAEQETSRKVLIRLKYVQIEKRAQPQGMGFVLFFKVNFDEIFASYSRPENPHVDVQPHIDKENTYNKESTVLLHGLPHGLPQAERPAQFPSKKPLTKAERDSWDLRRWNECMKATERKDYRRDTDEEWKARARQAAFEASVSPERIVQLLKQHFPNDPNIDTLYDQKPLFTESAG